MSDINGEAQVLDAGFGFGQYTYYIIKRFPHAKIESVEIESEMIEDFDHFLTHQRIGNVKLALADLTKIQYEGEFDFAFCIDVMEHIEDDDAVFRNICRSLKTGGIFYMTTPHFPQGAQSGSMEFVGEHVRDGYSKPEIEAKLSEAGFSRIKVDFTYGEWGALAWNLLQRYPMSLLKISKLFLALLPLYFALVYPAAELFMYLDVKSDKKTGSGLAVTAWK